MNSLIVQGFGSNIRVEKAKLMVKDGNIDLRVPSEYVLKPKQAIYDSIVVYGHSGSVSLEALRWCVKQNVPFNIMDWKGDLITSVNPPESVKTKLKFKQYQIYQSDSDRLNIAKEFIKAKFQNSKILLEWLKQKYPEIKTDFKEEDKLSKCERIPVLLALEGRTANEYWKEILKIIPSSMEWDGRSYRYRPMGASDPVNVLLNYGYGLLESRCLRSINSVGLDPHVGFLHEVNIGKLPLVYDLQEPFRWLVDLTVIKAIENKAFTNRDFLRTENYNLKLRPEAARKLVKLFEKQLNSDTSFHNYSWDYVILLKARELAFFIEGKTKKIDFMNPIPSLIRKDSSELREKIKNMTWKQAKALGISHGGFWDLKRRVNSNEEFTIYPKMEEKLDEY